MKIKQYTIVLIVASILFAGCSKKETIGSTNEPTIKVTVNAPTATNNPLLAASGKIEAVNSANLSTRMMGFVTKVYVNVGQKSHKRTITPSHQQCRFTSETCTNKCRNH